MSDSTLYDYVLGIDRQYRLARAFFITVRTGLILLLMCAVLLLLRPVYGYVLSACFLLLAAVFLTAYLVQRRQALRGARLADRYLDSQDCFVSWLQLSAEADRLGPLYNAVRTRAARFRQNTRIVPLRLPREWKWGWTVLLLLTAGIVLHTARFYRTLPARRHLSTVGADLIRRINDIDRDTDPPSPNKKKDFPSWIPFSRKKEADDEKRFRRETVERTKRMARDIEKDGDNRREAVEKMQREAYRLSREKTRREELLKRAARLSSSKKKQKEPSNWKENMRRLREKMKRNQLSPQERRQLAKLHRQVMKGKAGEKQGRKQSAEKQSGKASRRSKGQRSGQTSKSGKTGQNGRKRPASSQRSGKQTAGQRGRQGKQQGEQRGKQQPRPSSDGTSKQHADGGQRFGQKQMSQLIQRLGNMQKSARMLEKMRREMRMGAAKAARRRGKPGKKPGGQRAGRGSGSGLYGKRTGLPSAGARKRLSGKKSRKGKVHSTTKTVDPGEKPSPSSSGNAAPSKARFEKHQKRAERIIYNPKIPVGYADKVRDYFESIRP